MHELVTRAKGYLHDDPFVVQDQLVSKHVSGLIGVGVETLPSHVDYTRLLDKIPDQGPTQSCVGQAFATACLLTARVAGLIIPRPSAKAIWDFARAEDRPYQELINVGCRPLAALGCMIDNGLISDDDWPLDASNANALPPLDVYQEALAARVADWYRITPGPGAAATIRSALARGYCPVFAMPVDDPYERLSDASIYEGRAQASNGAHMQAIAGSGDRHLIIVSSWGEGHGERGIVRIADDYIDSGECTSIIVVKVVPPLTA